MKWMDTKTRNLLFSTLIHDVRCETKVIIVRTKFSFISQYSTPVLHSIYPILAPSHPILPTCSTFHPSYHCFLPILPFVPVLHSIHPTLAFFPSYHSYLFYIPSILPLLPSHPTSSTFHPSYPCFRPILPLFYKIFFLPGQYQSRLISEQILSFSCLRKYRDIIIFSSYHC